MRVMIAGGTGAVGRPLATQLSEAGHEVIATTRSHERAAQLRAVGIQALRMDALDRNSVDFAMEAAAPDAIIHQLTSLAEGDLEQNARLRRDGTRNLVGSAKRVGVDRLIAQSIAWAYAAGAGPADESVPLDVMAPLPRGATVAGVLALEDTVDRSSTTSYCATACSTDQGPGTRPAGWWTSSFVPEA